MNDTTITLRGYVGNDVALRDAGDTQVANFRVGATPRLFNRATEEWFDGPTQWYTVNAWRQLAHNVKRSIFKGEPVVVHGRLTVREWADKDGVLRVSLEVDADSVGHDLLRGTTAFVRPARSTLADPGGPVEPTLTDLAVPWSAPGVGLPAAEDGSADAPVPATGETGGDGDAVADWRAA